MQDENLFPIFAIWFFCVIWELHNIKMGAPTMDMLDCLSTVGGWDSGRAKAKKIHQLVLRFIEHPLNNILCAKKWNLWSHSILVNTRVELATLALLAPRSNQLS